MSESIKARIIEKVILGDPELEEIANSANGEMQVKMQIKDWMIVRLTFDVIKGHVRAFLEDESRQSLFLQDGQVDGSDDMTREDSVMLAHELGRVFGGLDGLIMNSMPTEEQIHRFNKAVEDAIAREGIMDETVGGSTVH